METQGLSKDLIEGFFSFVLKKIVAKVELSRLQFTQMMQEASYTLETYMDEEPELQINDARERYDEVARDSWLTFKEMILAGNTVDSAVTKLQSILDKAGKRFVEAVESAFEEYSGEIIESEKEEYQREVNKAVERCIETVSTTFIFNAKVLQCLDLAERNRKNKTSASSSSQQKYKSQSETGVQAKKMKVEAQSSVVEKPKKQDEKSKLLLAVLESARNKFEEEIKFTVGEFLDGVDESAKERVNVTVEQYGFWVQKTLHDLCRTIENPDEAVQAAVVEYSMKQDEKMMEEKQEDRLEENVTSDGGKVKGLNERLDKVEGKMSVMLHYLKEMNERSISLQKKQEQCGLNEDERKFMESLGKEIDQSLL